MPRPVGCRRISGLPNSTYFKPRGIPLRELEVVTLSLDELEALRLADHEGLYQERAASRMGISRQTFGRIVSNARRKVAECLIEGKALEIDGGNVVVESLRTFHCDSCGHTWQEPFGTGRPQACPACQSQELHRVDAGCGRGGSGKCLRRTQVAKEPREE